MEALVVVGLGIVVITLVDMVATVIGVSGGHAWISRTVSRSVWSGAAALHRRAPSHAALRIAGPAVVVGITLVWTLSLVLGWAVVFAADGALRSTDGDGAVVITDVADHAAAMVLGGSSPLAGSDGQPWSLLSRAARFTGIGLTSLGIAYALPIVGAVVRYRRVARSMSSLGGRDGDLMTTAWLDGHDSVVHLHLINLTADLAQVAEEIRAYPVVPFFHSREPDAAMAVAVDRLHRFLQRRSADHTTVPSSVVEPLEQALEGVLEVIRAHFLAGAVDGDDARATIDAWLDRDGWVGSEGWATVGAGH